jgi:isopenicillin N synthase-like dioxygenase
MVEHGIAGTTSHGANLHDPNLDAGPLDEERLAPGLGGRIVAFDEIPVIDLTALLDHTAPQAAVQATAEALGRAAERVGFVYISGHGVPDALTAEMFDISRRYFDQPLEIKLAQHIRNSPNHRGYFPLFEENTDPDLTADLKEGFDMARDLDGDAPEVRAGLPLHGPNQWPDSPETFKPVAQRYFAEMTRLGHAIMRGFALALDLPEDFFEDKIDRPLAQLRLLHYPPQAGHIQAETLGCGAHTDYGCLTILAQDPNGGLQVQNAAGEWIAAPPIPGTFVINLGDQLARWTNGRYSATPHRVINTSGRERYSMPFFFDPNFETVIECLPGCLAPNEPPRFPPVQAGPYLMSRYDATFSYRKDPQT